MISQRYIEKKYARMLEDYKKVEFSAKNNNYVCPDCGHITKTVDIDPGITPFMFPCDACGELARSTFYSDRVPDRAPIVEWYRPSLKETMKLRKKPEMIDHIIHGGLLSRKIKIS